MQSPLSTLQPPHPEAVDFVDVDLNDKSRRSFQGSEELRKFISLASGTEHGRSNSSTVVRLVAQEEQQQQQQQLSQVEEPSNSVYEMTPSNPSGISKTLSINDNNDNSRFDISLELPILDDNMAALMWKSAQTGDLSNLQYAIQSGCTTIIDINDSQNEDDENTNNNNNNNTNDAMVDRTQLVNQRNPENECTLLYTVIVSNDDHRNNKHKKEYPLLPMMEFLLDYGADPTAQNVYNVQAIHAVAIHCQEPLAPIELLLKHQVDPNARDGDGWTPMHYVARFYHDDPRDILQRLEQYGANVNAVDVTQKSPLFPLLANGDYANTLDWFIHSVKADVGLRGEFLDQTTRRTTQGTVLLQAAKYARRQCLAVLTNSAVAMDTFRIVMTQEELNQATLFVRQQLDKVSDLLHPKENNNGDEDDDRKSSDSTITGSSVGDKSTLEKAYDDLDAMATMLEDLRRTLEEDKTSTLAAEIYLERTGQQLIPRRQSLLGSLRRKSRQQHQQQQQLIQQVQLPSLQKPPMAKMKNLTPRVIQDFTSLSTASLGSLVSSLTVDKENLHEDPSNHPTVERRTSLLKRVSNMLMRQQQKKEESMPSQPHQVA